MNNLNADNSSDIKNYWENMGKSACPDDIVRDLSITEISLCVDVV